MPAIRSSSRENDPNLGPHKVPVSVARGVVRCPSVSGRRPGSAALLAGVLVVVFASATAAASRGHRVGSLRNEVHTLDARAHHALLDLYALDTRLHAAQARLDSLQVEATQLRKDKMLLAQQRSEERRVGKGGKD